MMPFWVILETVQNNKKVIMGIGNHATLKKKNKAFHATAPLVLHFICAAFYSGILTWRGKGEGAVHKIWKFLNMFLKTKKMVSENGYCAFLDSLYGSDCYNKDFCLS